MPATNPNRSQPLAGQAAEDASQPMSQLVRGMQGSEGAQPGLRAFARSTALGLAAPAAPEMDRFAGKGELLEADDTVVFTTTHDLVVRQEQLARNRLAQDRHWKNIKLGYTWSSLEKVQDQDMYRQAFPPGSESLRPSAVPNKAADLCNKLVEVLNTDPPQPSPQALTDSEAAERAAELAAQFLKQDGSEQGTDDETLFWCQSDLATTSATAFLFPWVDKTGGGWTPTQIKAHPKAQDANNPLVGPDGQPTTDYILRYVTEADEQGGIQFTDDPSKAGRTWLPKIRVEKLGREHVRLFPEDKDVNQCSAAVVLYYCTLGEAKRRWPDVVGEMSEQELAELCDWMPNRYMVLLPPALRSRWKSTTGSPGKDPQGSSSDERIMFYYGHFKMPCPDYAEGMAVYCNGARGGTVFERELLSATVEVPAESQQDKLVEQTYLMELPLIPIRLIQDAEERDPTGKAFMARIGSGSEAQATLANAYLEALDKILHPARFATATSPVEGWQVEESRNDNSVFVPVMSKDDFPFYEPSPPVPNTIFQMFEWTTEQLNSIASLPKPTQGAEGQQEVSGVARRIAVGQANISLGRMQQGLMTARKRYWRLKLQLAMKHWTVPQLLKFVGEDGAYKQEWFTGVDFSQVTGVEVMAGTGTMMPPQERVTYLSQMAQMNFLSPEEAAEAARPTFTQTLGIPADPQQQRIERQVSSFLEGPPKGWLEEATTFDQQQAAAQSQQPPAAGAPGQPPAPAAPASLPPLWTPFEPIAPDDEPQVAVVRLRRLRHLLGTVRFGAQPKRWQKTALDEYSRMRKAVADSAGAAAKAEQDKLLAVEQAKTQGAVQVAQQEAQVELQAQQAEAKLNQQIEQQKIELQKFVEQQKLAMQQQADQQKLALQQEADQQKLAVEQQMEQIKMDAELQRIRLEQEFEERKLLLEHQLELERMQVEGDQKLEQAEVAAANDREAREEARKDDKEKPNARPE